VAGTVAADLTSRARHVGARVALAHTVDTRLTSATNNVRAAANALAEATERIGATGDAETRVVDAHPIDTDL